MAIVVEHEKRRREILQNALDVFVEEGYEDATYQKIADHCQITRTTLYLYFRNRRDIFYYSIKQLLNDVENDILGVKSDASLAAPEKIKKTMMLILNRLEENRLLLGIILDYLHSRTNPGDVSKPNTSPDTRVRRRTIRLRHILTGMILEGIKLGELKKTGVAAVDDLFYGLIEAAIFRLVILKRDSVGELKAAAEAAVDGISLEFAPDRLIPRSLGHL